MAKQRMIRTLCVLLSMAFLLSGALSLLASAAPADSEPAAKPVIAEIDGIGKVLRGITPGTTLGELAESFADTYTLTAGELEAGDAVSTGTPITVQNGEVVVGT